ncbi:DUF4870 domain-containing protein [Candidatus Woesearchaeota archaeon]|jgi:uncharacterized membrane protein|nr:DUF4870 domain-containing protein [Candidatus Woesearchaeota archaeon]MBT6995330.1 DUF4870 domain-containing protein [Candidatus Woesearchaeota archaeon]MBT7238047.1 DUF4870 domain-containing protein [Candidatus Woesearchaeota archaeon]
MIRKKSRTNAFITTFFSIFGFITALLLWKKDKYVMHYAKQSLVIFLFAVLSSIILTILGWIPILGWVIALGLRVLVFVAWVYNWTYALSGEKKYIPVIGEYAKKIDL